MKVVITGGSRGIGRKLTEGLIGSGMKVVVVSKSRISQKNFKRDISERIKDVELVEYRLCDVASRSEVDTAFKSIGDFDALINCAGILGPVGDFATNDLNLWGKAIEVNLMGTVHCCKAAIPILSKRPCTKIINVAGGGGAYSRPYHTAYGCSKTAVIRFTETLAHEFRLSRTKIDVNVLAPGAHKTDMWKEETHDKEPERWADLNRLMDTIRFFLSEKSDGINGKFIHIYDEWEKLMPEISKGEKYTLRRIT